eukprot:5299404-Pyramimonas_sp.AAC.1
MGTSELKRNIVLPRERSSALILAFFPHFDPSQSLYLTHTQGDRSSAPSSTRLQAGVEHRITAT